ncbi:unnamed protein product, partial [Laminaria digitata]
DGSPEPGGEKASCGARRAPAQRTPRPQAAQRKRTRGDSAVPKGRTAAPGRATATRKRKKPGTAEESATENDSDGEPSSPRRADSGSDREPSASRRAGGRDALDGPTARRRDQKKGHPAKTVPGDGDGASPPPIARAGKAKSNGGVG